MYKIACNWSGALYDLITTKQVDVDYIKTGAFGAFDEHYGTMLAHGSVLIHGFGHYETAGMKNIDVVDFGRANRLLSESGSPHYGLHLAITNEDMKPDLKEADIPAHMSKNIEIFKKNLKVPLLLENIPESPQEVTLYDYVPYSSPEQINRVVLENDVGMILDVTHAKIACMYRKWDIHDYLKALPLHLIKEVHVNGSGWDTNGFPDDTHNAMEDEDYALLDWVLTRANPSIISLEYIGIPAETPEIISANLLTQLTKLKKL